MTVSPAIPQTLADRMSIRLMTIDGVPVGWMTTDGVLGRLSFGTLDDPTSAVDFLLPTNRWTSIAEIGTVGRIATNKNNIVTSLRLGKNEKSKKLRQTIPMTGIGPSLALYKA